MKKTTKKRVKKLLLQATAIGAAGAAIACSSSSEMGSQAVDGGYPADGSTLHDAGHPVGTAPIDAGLVADDAGTSVVDAGIATNDAGDDANDASSDSSSAPDGLSIHDGGELNPSDDFGAYA